MHGKGGSIEDAWRGSVQQDAILIVVTWILGHVKCSHLGKRRWNDFDIFKKKVWSDRVFFSRGSFGFLCERSCTSRGHAC
jgi:hypothetical protein